MTFIEHTKELIKRLRMIFVSVAISTILVMLIPVSLDSSLMNPFYSTISSSTIRTIQESFLPPEVEILPLSFLAPLEGYVLISFLIGVIISLPVIFYEIYKFINPALYSHEKKTVLQFLLSFIGMFGFGFALGWLYVVPATIRMLYMFSGVLGFPPVYDFSSFLSLVGFTLFLCGLLFTLPIYIVLLVKAGFLETKSLTKNRKFLYGGLIIGISILDPDPSLITETLLAIPLVSLTEISIIIAKRIEKNREAQAR